MQSTKCLEWDALDAATQNELRQVFGPEDVDDSPEPWPGGCRTEAEFIAYDAWVSEQEAAWLAKEMQDYIDMTDDSSKMTF